MPRVYQLQNWYFTPHRLGKEALWDVHGNIFGHPKFPEGIKVHTSAVQSVRVGLEALEVQTRNSVYQCPYSSCKDPDGSFLDAEALFPEPPGEEALQALVTAIYTQRWEQGPPTR